MFFLTTPTDARVREILASVSAEPFNYPHQGATRTTLESAPSGYVLDRYGTLLGHGEGVFDRAREVLRRFENYPSSFTRVIRLTETCEMGTVFGTLARHFGFASMHPCRILEVIEEQRPRRSGFALGTLPGHIEAGEERFLLTLDERDESVRYDVQAISRPVGFVARLGSPMARHFQLRFQRETCAQMQSLCSESASSSF